MSLEYALLGASAFLALAVGVALWRKQWESDESPTLPLTNELPPTPTDEIGATRIQVTTYGDCRKTYIPEVYTEVYSVVSSPYYSWQRLPSGEIDYNCMVVRRDYKEYTSLVDAQLAIDKYLYKVRSKTVLNTEYIKYP
jgi:hypothetical protein